MCVWEWGGSEVRGWVHVCLSLIDTHAWKKEMWLLKNLEGLLCASQPKLTEVQTWIVVSIVSGLMYTCMY